jgi:hypothetical protein
VSNLEATTRKENINHARLTGLNINVGETCPTSKISEHTARLVCKLLVKYNGSPHSVRNELIRIGTENVNINQIADIKRKKNWVSVSDDYFDKNHFSNLSIKISEDDIVYVCKLLVKYNGLIQFVMTDIKSLGMNHIHENMVKSIKYKYTHRHISDKYFSYDGGIFKSLCIKEDYDGTHAK